MAAGERDAILAWRRREPRLALATVVATWGSAPRPAGALLAADAAGSFMGSVSGGCIEAAVIGAAQEALAGGRPQLLEFGVSDEDAFAAGLACGGEIKVFVQAFDDALFQALEKAGELLQRRQSCVLCLDLADGKARLYEQEEDEELARTAWQAAKPGPAAVADKSYFINPQLPPLRLVIVGAVHIAQSLAALASQLGIEPVVIDPRPAWATEERFPGVELIRDWPDRALPGIGLDARTAVATLTHDPKIDDVALQAVLGSDAFYVGSLGSRKTHAKRLERLGADAGLAEKQLARIHAPIGLDIGADSAAEIALAVMAEVVAKRPRP
ncbi:MAG: XdhC family protein [Betaproteobacteria bacterium AqS2]|uniref:XdhC family protein n=1 Tax=Candidatus Amphirhobacter heronislandensis TaxID=1732024 RepID=A0A930UGB6_9GAMM|nr:XdhC family protein [Betaproteobacteria bacterium AqS2]